MKYILILLLLFSGGARSAPATPAELVRVQFMVNECKKPMDSDVCRVQVDADKCVGAPNQRACLTVQFHKRFPAGLTSARLGVIQPGEYVDVAMEGPAMCERLGAICTADFGGRACGLRTVLWRQR